MSDANDAPRPEQPGELKAAALLSYDLAMLATAGRYNLDVLAERTRSQRHLVDLYMKLTQLAGVDLFVEAGAKEASASRRATELLPSARVVAFEANPYTFAKYVTDNEPRGVEYLNLALNDTPGPVTINVHRDEHGDPIANGQASLLQRQKERKDFERGFHEVTVDGVTLDDFFADHHYQRAGLWVDVEGACQFVLSGARKLLTNTAVAMIEVEDATYWGADHWLRERVVSFMYDQGLVPVARDFENVTQWASQYNIVFVQAALLGGGFDKLRNEVARFRSLAYTPPAAPPLVAAQATQPAVAPAPPVPAVSELATQLAARVARGAKRRARRRIRTLRKRLTR